MLSGAFRQHLDPGRPGNNPGYFGDMKGVLDCRMSCADPGSTLVDARVGWLGQRTRVIFLAAIYTGAQRGNKLVYFLSVIPESRVQPGSLNKGQSQLGPLLH